MARLMGLPDDFRVPDAGARGGFGAAKEVIGNGIHGATTENFISPLAERGVQIRRGSTTEGRAAEAPTPRPATKRALLARYTAEASSIRKVKADAKVRLNERRSMAKRAREQRRIKEREIGAIGEQYEARFRKTSEGAGVRLLQEREKVLGKIASASKGAAARITKLEAERFGIEDSAAVANYAVESILGTHVGRNPYDVTVKSPASKPLKNRKITLSDAELDNWLVHDVRQVAQAYVRTVVPDVEIAREFGDVQASKLLKSLDDEAKARREIIDKNFHDQAEGPGG